MVRLFLLAFILFTPAALAQHMNQGTDFWLCFDQNYKHLSASDTTPFFSDKLTLRFQVVSSHDDVVQIRSADDSFSKMFKVLQGQILSIEMPESYEVFQSGVSKNKAIHVTTKYPACVQAFNHRFQSSESFSVLDASSLGTMYVLCGAEKLSQELRSQASIIATENNTDVSIVLPDGVRVDGTTERALHVVLQAGELYHLVASYASVNSADLSGGSVRASKPIAVFSGSSLAYVPVGTRAGNPLVEQLHPLEFWGKTYVTMAPRGRTQYSVKVVVSSSDCDIEYQRGDGIEKHRVAANSSYVINHLRGSTIIRSSQPVQCFELTHGFGDGDNIGDPCMISLRPVEHFGTSCLIAPLDLNLENDTIQRQASTEVQSFCYYPGDKSRISYVAPSATIEPEPQSRTIDIELMKELRDARKPKHYSKVYRPGIGPFQQVAYVCVLSSALDDLKTEKGRRVSLQHVETIDGLYSVGEIDLDTITEPFELQCSTPFGVMIYGYPDYYDAFGHGL